MSLARVVLHYFGVQIQDYKEHHQRRFPDCPVTDAYFTLLLYLMWDTFEEDWQANSDLHRTRSGILNRNRNTLDTFACIFSASIHSEFESPSLFEVHLLAKTHSLYSSTPCPWSFLLHQLSKLRFLNSFLIEIPEVSVVRSTWSLEVHSNFSCIKSLDVLMYGLSVVSSIKQMLKCCMYASQLAFTRPNP